MEAGDAVRLVLPHAVVLCDFVERVETEDDPVAEGTNDGNPLAEPLLHPVEDVEYVGDVVPLLLSMLEEDGVALRFPETDTLPEMDGEEESLT